MSFFPEPVDITFDDATMSVALDDGRTITVPLAWYPRLTHATREQLLDFELSPGGVHWDALDEDLAIEGMMASFIFGFLGTAGPRLTSASHFSPGELGILFTLDLLAAGAHAAGAHRFADICFLICLMVFVVIMLKRFRARLNNPPPNFV